MSHGKQKAQAASFADMMDMKSSARIEQVRAVYDADRCALDLAAQYVKSALRGNSGPIDRPRRFATLHR